MFPGLQPGGTSRRYSSSGIPPPVELEAAVAILCQDKRNDVVRPKGSTTTAAQPSENSSKIVVQWRDTEVKKERKVKIGVWGHQLRYQIQVGSPFPSFDPKGAPGDCR